jgi:type II secretory pathway pseudopilin PulG
MRVKFIKGFTLIEMIVYTAILGALFVLIVNTLLIVSKSYKSIKLTSDVNNSAAIALEKLTREIRLASDVNLGSSVLGVNPGRLYLSSTDENGNPINLDFYISGGTLNLNENGALFGALTKGEVSVTNLIFRHIVSSTSQMVKIEMELTASDGSKTVSEDFYASAVLRSSY